MTMQNGDIQWLYVISCRAIFNQSRLLPSPLQRACWFFLSQIHTLHTRPAHGRVKA